MNEIDSKTMAAIRSILTTTRTFLGGFRFDCPQDDDKFYTELKMAEEIVTNSRPKQENDPEEVDKVEKVAEKIKQCESDLARNQRCKVVVLVQKP